MGPCLQAPNTALRQHGFSVASLRAMAATTFPSTAPPTAALRAQVASTSCRAAPTQLHVASTRRSARSVATAARSGDGSEDSRATAQALFDRASNALDADEEPQEEVNLWESPTFHVIREMLIEDFEFSEDDPTLDEHAANYLIELLEHIELDEEVDEDAGICLTRIAGGLPSFMEFVSSRARSDQRFALSEEDLSTPEMRFEPELQEASSETSSAAAPDADALARLSALAAGTGRTREEYTDISRSHALAPELVSAVIGLGTWRLNGLMQEPFEVLASQVEGMWRQTYELQLAGYPLARQWEMMDSMDPDHRLGGQSYLTLDDPEKGEEGWPRLLLENRCYNAPQFRKLHIELCARQDGLQVLHCVMFPKPEYDLPIFGLDIVGSAQGLGFAILDLSPVAGDRALPHDLREGLRALQRELLPGVTARLPPWGSAIFSDHCIALRPTTVGEVDAFIQYAVAAARLYIVVAANSQRAPESEHDRIRAAHSNYCEMQLKNAKTRAVLAAAFGGDVADAYMSDVMFDVSAGFNDVNYPGAGQPDYGPWPDDRAVDDGAEEAELAV